MMEFILLPMAYKGDEEKNRMISEVAELADRIEDQETRVFILTGIIVFADKVISDENGQRVRRMIAMTRKNYNTADFIMEQLSFEELGLITGGVGLDAMYMIAASPNDIPPQPWFPK